MRKALTDDQIHEAAHLVGLGLSYWQTIKFMRLHCSMATLARWINAARMESIRETKDEVREHSKQERIGDDLYEIVWN